MPSRQVKKPDPNEILFAQDHGMVVVQQDAVERRHAAYRRPARLRHGIQRGKYLDYVSRVNKPGLHPTQHVDIPPPANGVGAVLEILVDSFGHVGYGQAMYDFKGIVGAATLDGEELHDWQAHSLPLDETYIAGLAADDRNSPKRFVPACSSKPSSKLDQLGDCYIDMSEWDKGYRVGQWSSCLAVIGNIGPQQRLYCPASWFVHGHNELLVFDMHRVSGASIRCSNRLQG
jgi:hypothetical protein